MFREDIEDQDRSGRPPTLYIDENVEKLNFDRRVSVRLLADECHVPKMRKICSKMVLSGKAIKEATTTFLMGVHVDAIHGAFNDWEKRRRCSNTEGRTLVVCTFICAYPTFFWGGPCIKEQVGLKNNKNICLSTSL